MQSFEIRLKSVNDVRDFVQILSTFPYDIDLESGRYVVDAKSIMGIFSLNFEEPMTVKIHTAQDDLFAQKIKPFLVPDDGIA